MTRDEAVVEHVPRAMASMKQGTGIIHHFLTKRGSKVKFKLLGRPLIMGEDMGWKSPAFSRLLDS